MTEEKQPENKYFYLKELKVTKIELELTGKNDEFLYRIAFVTKDGEVTYKPKKVIQESGDLAGFSTKSTKSKLYSVSEFVLENPMLKSLNDNCKKAPQTIILNYVSMKITDETKDNFGETYTFMRDSQFKMIYYKEFHGEDESNLNEMAQSQEKYTKKEME